MDSNLNPHTLHALLTGDNVIDKARMQQWGKSYPYFSVPLMMYTREHHTADKEALRLSAIYAGDIEVWASQLGLSANFEQFRTSSPHNATKSTLDTIDLFLDTYSNEEEYAVELPIALDSDSSINGNYTTGSRKEQPLITIPAYDYLSELETMPDAHDAHPMQGNDLLEKFLEADAAGEQLFSKPEFTATTAVESPKKHATEENESFFSESLAKIYIQQRRYAKALEIIRKLNLNNPEKNIYFADQIRFLEKLIINVKN
jgi:hypothetical protein